MSPATVSPGQLRGDLRQQACISVLIIEVGGGVINRIRGWRNVKWIWEYQAGGVYLPRCSKPVAHNKPINLTYWKSGLHTKRAFAMLTLTTLQTWPSHQPRLAHRTEHKTGPRAVTGAWNGLRAWPVLNAFAVRADVQTPDHHAPTKSN
eukprot:1161512-Pelagomonas_calceolata.AAC.32